MSEYKSIKGKTVQFLGTDPSDTGAEGQVWYNSAAGAFKSLVALEAWSSGAPLSTARNALYGSGSQTAGLAIGGETTAATGVTEEYNGSGWSSGGSLSTARYHLAAAGTQTSSIAFGGDPGSAPNVTNATEEYDGSTWTAGGNLPTAKATLGGAGTLTAGLSFGGSTAIPITASSNTTEEYDGSAWTAGGNLNTAKHYTTGAGTQTAGLNVSGAVPPGNTLTAASEEYNGTSWTSGNSSNTAKLARRAFGLQTSAVLFGGESPYSTATETYDGTSWSTSPATLSTAVSNSAQSGTNGSAGLQAGGFASTADTSISQEYNKSTSVITAAAWSSGGNLGTARYGLGATGEPNSLVANAGSTGSVSGLTEEYNGSSWTASNAVNTARFYVTNFGNSQTAAVMVNGRTPGETFMNDVEEYDGTSWTTVTDAPYNANGVNSFGTESAGVIAGGNNPGIPGVEVAEYNGTGWTAATSLPGVKKFAVSVGTQTAGLVGGGGPTATTVSCFTYDGTSWASIPNINQAREGVGSGGTSTAAIGGSGYFAPVIYLSSTSLFDGTSWYTGANVATGRYAGGAGSTSTAAGTSAVLTGGQSGPPAFTNQTATEEYNGETSALNVKTLTTS